MPCHNSECSSVMTVHWTALHCTCFEVTWLSMLQLNCYRQSHMSMLPVHAAGVAAMGISLHGAPSKPLAACLHIAVIRVQPLQSV